MKVSKKAVAAAVGWVVAVSGAGLGCRGNSQEPATKPWVPPVASGEQNAPLVVQLLVLPAEVTGTRGPSTQPTKPATLRMTLVVTNTTADRTYRGEAPNAAIARFALECDGQPIWTNSEFSAQVITPVAIGPGQKMTYHASAYLADIRPYAGRALTAHASFAPAGLNATSTIPVR